MVNLLSMIPGIGYYFLTPTQQTEYKIQRYRLLFEKAVLQGHQVSLSIHQEVAHLAASIESSTHKAEVIRSCDELLWLDKVSRSPNYVLAERTPEGGYILKVQPKALELSLEDFCWIIAPLVNGQTYPVIIQEISYTSQAISHCIGTKRLSSPKDFVEIIPCRLKEEKIRNCTIAQIKGLGLAYPVVDLSNIDESLFNFVYEVFVDGRYLDQAWWNLHSCDEFVRLCDFVNKFMPERKSSIPVFAQGNNTNVLTIAEDRLLLDAEQFHREMKAALEFYKSAQTIEIRQSKSPFPLVFRRDKFNQLVDAKIDPSFLHQVYTVQTGKEETKITADAFFQICSFLSERAGPNWKPSVIFEIPQHSRRTLAHAIQYVKTNQLPLLTWADEYKLVAFLQECAPDTCWEKDAVTHFVAQEPYISEEELELYNWVDLAEFLVPYTSDKGRTIQLGHLVYALETLKKFIAKSPRIPVSLLAKRVWFEQSSGKKIEGGLDLLRFMPSVLERYPQEVGAGEYNNPIRLSENDLRLNWTLRFPNEESFKLIRSLKRFVHLINLQNVLDPIEKKLSSSVKIYIGDKLKKPCDYWKEVGQELKKYDQAQLIVLDGCTTVWPRETVRVFCDHGNLTFEDLNTPILLKFYDDNSPYGCCLPAYRQTWLAQWKCLSSSNPAIDRSGQSNQGDLLSAQHYDEFKGLLFGESTMVITRHGDKKQESLRFRFLRILSPYALQKLDPKPKPEVKQRVYLNETSIFYARRILAIAWIALGIYVDLRYGVFRSSRLIGNICRMYILIIGLMIDRNGYQIFSRNLIKPSIKELSLMCATVYAYTVGKKYWPFILPQVMDWSRQGVEHVKSMSSFFSQAVPKVSTK